MPTPEFIAVPEFVKFRCSNTDDVLCPTCPRDFAIQISMIEGVYKTSAGKALLLLRGVHYVPSPFCGRKLQIIQTFQDYEAVISLLDGKIVNFGEVIFNPDISISVNG